MSQGELVKVEQSQQVEPSLIQVIQDGIRTKGIDPVVLHSLFDLRIRVESRDAERAFNVAFAAMQKRLPRIVKDGKISLETSDGRNKGKSIPFATYENVMDYLNPLSDEYGFSHSITSLDSERDGVLLTLTVRHEAGHSVASSMRMPPDSGHLKGLKAIGSAFSFCKRYLVLGFWNIVTVKEDDDATSAHDVITVNQRRILTDMMIAVSQNESKFLEWANVKNLADLPAHKYFEAFQLLNRKVQAMGAK